MYGNFNYTRRLLLYFFHIVINILLPSAADASGVHASTIVIDHGGTPSPVGRLVEDAPGGGGRKTDVVL